MLHTFSQNHLKVSPGPADSCPLLQLYLRFYHLHFLSTQPTRLPEFVCFGPDGFLGFYSNQVHFTLKAFTLTMASAKSNLVWSPYSVLIFIMLVLDWMGTKAAPLCFTLFLKAQCHFRFRLLARICGVYLSVTGLFHLM